MIIKLFAGLIVGGSFGALLGYFGKCSSGACPLTANPFRGAIYGAFIGVFLMSMMVSSRPAANTAANAADGSKNNMVIKIGSKEAFEKIMSSQGVFLVDFYAEWCRPCKMLSPVIDSLAEKYAGRLTFTRLDVSELGNIAGDFKISGTPTVVFIKDGKEVGRLVGLHAEGNYVETIEKIIQ